MGGLLETPRAGTWPDAVAAQPAAAVVTGTLLCQQASLWIALSITRLLPLLPLLPLLLLALMLLSPPCRAGDVLFRLGIPAEEFYLLESGTGGVLSADWYCTALILP